MDKSHSKLAMLGWVQLAAYLLFLWAIVQRSGIATMLSIPSDDGMLDAGEFGTSLVNAYLLGGLTLIPSAVMFIKNGKTPKLKLISGGKTLQTILFAACCMAFVPLLLMQSSEVPIYQSLLGATAFGLVCFPIQLAFTGRAIKALGKLGLD